MQGIDEAGFYRLVDKYQQGTCTEEEVRLLRSYYLYLLKNQPDSLPPGEPAYIKDRAWAAIQQGVWRRKTPRIRRIVSIAAAALVVASVAGYFMMAIPAGRRYAVSAEDVLPGGNRATLTLADGRVINLDEAQTGIIVGTDHITYTDGSNIALSPAGGGRGRFDEIKELALTTPKGGTYAITLPDGSKVWLNANSKLNYPSRFHGDERVVTLIGEAYFEISKLELSRDGGGRGKLPFKVITNDQTIEVLGTEFNVSAYQDEEDTKTTLVQGRVKVSGNVLSPGQQATTHGGQLEVKEVNVKDYTSWKEGYFSFTGTVEEIARELARWYDLELVIERPVVPGRRVTMNFPRDQPLGDVLYALQAIVPELGYRVEGVQTKGDNVKAERRLTVFREKD